MGIKSQRARDVRLFVKGSDFVVCFDTSYRSSLERETPRINVLTLLERAVLKQG